VGSAAKPVRVNIRSAGKELGASWSMISSENRYPLFGIML
jgi:hypothetical protein